MSQEVTGMLVWVAVDKGWPAIHREQLQDDCFL